jgi:hypothetical protein
VHGQEKRLDGRIQLSLVASVPPIFEPVNAGFRVHLDAPRSGVPLPIPLLDVATNQKEYRVFREINASLPLACKQRVKVFVCEYLLLDPST